MKPEELRDLGELASAAIGGAALRVYDMHEGIAGRVFGAIGPMGEPVRSVHDAVARVSYRRISQMTATGVRLGANAASMRRAPNSPSIEDSSRGRIALGALNGAFGDLLAESGSGLALPMSLRLGGIDIALTREALARAYPDATPRLALFVHGLCETDGAWRLGAERHVPYGSRLRAELGYTPLYLRYNSGLHISSNGQDLARLLGDLVARWPVEVSELTLIGHSMGALVSRSACHYGREADWVSTVRHVFMLGGPHHGAPLEQVAKAAAAALERLPETRMFAKTLNLRSAGVKDLSHGYLVDEDWSGGGSSTEREETSRDESDPTAEWGGQGGPGREIPFLPGAGHYFVSATVSREPDATAGRLVGDLLVLRPSAWAVGRKGERMRFPVEHYRDFGGINHFQLLNHPAIYEQLKRWMGSRRALEASVEA